MRKIFIINCLVFIICLLLIVPAQTFAQTPAIADENGDVEATLGVARIIEINATDPKLVKDGSIVSAGQRGAILTNIPYDSQVLGIVSRDAAIILNSTATSADRGLPIISTGTVYVLISSAEGNVKKGDLLASSVIPGVATKASKDGFVLGTALEDYSNNDKKAVSTIAVSLDLHYFNSKPVFPGNLSDVFKVIMLPTKEGPSPVIKYIVAAMVVLGSMILGFFTFGRAAAKGVEALGRNPAASRIIHMGIIFNVTIVVAIALAGLGVAFLILRL